MSLINSSIAPTQQFAWRGADALCSVEERDFQLLNDRWIVARFVKSSVAIAAQGTRDPLVGDDGTGELTVN